MQVGIISYGTHVPRTRVKVGKLGVEEKTLASNLDDATTLGVQAAIKALHNFDKTQVQALYVGSESHAYAVKPTSAIIANQLNLNLNLFAADLEFACKAGTAALQVASSLVASNQVSYALALGTDTGTAKKGDPLNHTIASGAAAFLLGPVEEAIATIDKTTSITQDTTDFWKAQGEKHPDHTGRFTADTYKTLVSQAINSFTDNLDTYRFIVLHAPNLKLPSQLDLDQNKLINNQVAKYLGNTLSANTLIGLAAALDQAQPNDKILVCSYGSGAGCDVFEITATDKIGDYHPAQSVQDMIQDKIYHEN